MKREQQWWQCPCGKRVSVSAERIKMGLESLPQLWSCIGSSSQNAASPSVAGTQTINVRDMARMAQEGIDVSVSGEWDTSIRHSQRQRPNGDDSK